MKKRIDVTISNKEYNFLRRHKNQYSCWFCCDVCAGATYYKDSQKKMYRKLKKKRIKTWEYRMYRTWKHNRKTQYRNDEE